MENKLLTAQYVLKNASGMQMSGFNQAVHGEVFFDNIQREPEIFQGFCHARDMINKGEIFYIHNFHKKECTGYEPTSAFQYGGFWCCNSCGKRSVDKKWWAIKVFRDGNEWCCIGEGFENLQVSRNYAFGKSREEAINNYGDKCIKE